MSDVSFVKVGVIKSKDKKKGKNFKVTIPAKIVKELGIEEGEYLKVYIDGNKICYEKVE